MIVIHAELALTAVNPKNFNNVELTHQLVVEQKAKASGKPLNGCYRALPRVA